jgi:hypothetical protein
LEKHMLVLFTTLCGRGQVTGWTLVLPPAKWSHRTALLAQKLSVSTEEQHRSGWHMWARSPYF